MRPKPLTGVRVVVPFFESGEHCHEFFGVHVKFVNETMGCEDLVGHDAQNIARGHLLHSKDIKGPLVQVLEGAVVLMCAQPGEIERRI